MKVVGNLLMLIGLGVAVLGCRTPPSPSVEASSLSPHAEPQVATHVTVKAQAVDQKASIPSEGWGTTAPVQSAGDVRVIGRVQAVGSVLRLVDVSVDLEPLARVTLCVRLEQALVRIGTATVGADSQGPMLKLNLRSIADEDGDLVVKAFTADPVRYIQKHEVVAVLGSRIVSK